MYHLGKVLAVFSPSDKKIISADRETQATLMMWDENVLTLLVNGKIREKIKKGDLVLVDYTLRKDIKVPTARQVIIKILKTEDAEEAWKEYKKYYEERRKRTVPPQPKAKPEPYQPQPYIR